MNVAPLWLPWLRMRADTGPVETGSEPRDLRTSRVACPHCTNIDTLSRHCPDDRCGWATCTCGAFLYGSRRHRHPRHGSDADTCHDPRAAA